MANESEFPKENGDYLFVTDVQMFWGAYPGFEQKNLSVTNADTSSSFSVNRQVLLVHNSGTKTAYLNFDTTATTNDFPILPGERWTFYGVVRTPHAICSGSDTTTIRIIGLGSTTATVGVSVTKLSCSQSNSSYTLPTGTHHIVMRNSGVNEVFINLDGAATTSHYQVDAGDTFRISPVGATTLQAICSTSETTTLNVVCAVRW